MFRLVLLSLAAGLLCASGAQAHSVHADCRVGDSRMGVVPHWHPGAYGQAQPCGGGGGGGRGYYEAPPPPPQQNYRGGYYGPGEDRLGRPGGPIIGHGAAVGCPPSFSRVRTPGGGTQCLEVP
jgi:hypothetical protein